MTNNLTEFPITQRWVPKNPDILQLYSMPTPNGQKVSIMLEEVGLDYEAHKIPFNDQGVTSPEFLSLNPNNKIPAILDPNGPDGTPLALFESGAILIYLAQKSGKFFGTSETQRAEILQWLMFQVGGVGPMMGQLGFFHVYGGKDFEDKRPLNRYLNETKRLLGVLDKQLSGRDWIAGDYSIADIAIAPWLNGMERFYNAAELTELHQRTNITTYLKRFNARPAVKRGEIIPEHNWG